MPQHDAQARDGAAESTSPGTGSLKARFVALRTLRPFIVMVWRISPSLTFWSLLLRLARALLPVATLYVGKLIIDDVVRLAQMTERPTTLPEWLDSGQFDRMIMLILTEFALAVVGRHHRQDRDAGRQPAGGPPDERIERQPHGARQDPRPRGFRGRRASRTSSNGRAGRPAGG